MCVKVPLELRKAHLRALPLTLVATMTATCRDIPMTPTACQESVAASLPTGDMFTQWGEHLGKQRDTQRRCRAHPQTAPKR